MVGYKEAMATYHDCFVSRFGIDGRDGKLLSGLLKAHGADQVTGLRGLADSGARGAVVDVAVADGVRVRVRALLRAAAISS